MARVRSSVLRAILTGMEHLGLDRGQLLRASRIDPARLADPDAYVAARSSAALWEEAAVMHAGDDLGLALARSIPPFEFGLLDYLLPSCPTVGEAFETYQRVHRLITTESHSTIVRREGEVHVVRQPRRPKTLGDLHRRDYLVGVRLVRIGELEPGFQASRVELEGPAVAPEPRYREAYRCPVSFGHPRTTTILSGDAWALPMSRRDDGLRALLERHASELLAKVPPGDVVEDAVHELTKMVPSGQTQLPALAKRLGMSARTLQRRLSERDLAYSTLLDRARLALAQAYLADRRLAIDEISTLVGYSDQRAFARAFRRWTGTTPSAFRRARSS